MNRVSFYVISNSGNSFLPIQKSKLKIFWFHFDLVLNAINVMNYANNTIQNTCGYYITRFFYIIKRKKKKSSTNSKNFPLLISVDLSYVCYWKLNRAIRATANVTGIHLYYVCALQNKQNMFFVKYSLLGCIKCNKKILCVNFLP